MQHPFPKVLYSVVGCSAPAAVGIVLLPGGAGNGGPNILATLITLCRGVLFYGHANIATDERPVGLGKYIGSC